MNHCSFFPDRIAIPGWITYDISGLCLLHDQRYEECYPRYLADREFYDGLCRTYPEYIKIWIIVYHAVRRVGGLFYWLHRLKAPEFVKGYARGKIKHEIEAGLFRFA